MSPFFKDAIAALLQCAQAHANFEHAMVQISAFEAINDLVRAASRDTLDVVAQLIQVRARGLRGTRRGAPGRERVKRGWPVGACGPWPRRRAPSPCISALLAHAARGRAALFRRARPTPAGDPGQDPRDV